MKIKLHKSNNRGSANFGWLKANYSFSFANYQNNDNIHFGALQVLNDDEIAPAMGFGQHPHNNMEIITIPLNGSLKHKDSMSNKWIPIFANEVQVMSAGSGVQHSEMNNSTIEPLSLFQIWIFPNKENVSPRYEQKKFDALERKNKLQVLVSSIDDTNYKNSLKIHQDALISRIDLEANKSYTYKINNENNGVFIMLIEGSVNFNNEQLLKRDAIEITELHSIFLSSLESSELLFIEVPMKF